MENEIVIKKVEGFFLNFSSILWEALPFVVLGAVIAGILEEMVPQRFITRILPRSRFLSILMGGMLGIIFPMCECGIIPIMRRLLRKGLPLSCCTSYLLAGPIVNVIVIASTFAAFSGMEKATDSSGHLTYQMGSVWMAGMRVGLGYLVAIGTSLIVEWQYRRHGSKLLLPLAMPRLQEGEEDQNSERRPWGHRISNISETALHDFVDITVFLILGALLTSFVRQWLTHDDVEALSRGYPLLSITFMMGLAVILCLCSEADAFVAASYIMLRPAAKLAFLVLGPMLDLKLYLMYTRVFRPRLIWTIFASVVVQVLVYCMITNLLWEHYAPQWLAATTPRTTGAP